MRNLLLFIFLLLLSQSLKAQNIDTNEVVIAKELELDNAISFNAEVVQGVPDVGESQMINTDTVVPQTAEVNMVERVSRNRKTKTERSNNAKKRDPLAVDQQQVANYDVTKLDSLVACIYCRTKSIDSLTSRFSIIEEYVAESQDKKGNISHIFEIVIILFLLYQAYRTRIAIKYVRDCLVKLSSNIDKVLNKTDEIKNDVELSKVQMTMLQSDLCEKMNLAINDLCKFHKLSSDLSQMSDNVDCLKRNFEELSVCVSGLQSNDCVKGGSLKEYLLEKSRTLIKLLQSDCEEKKGSPLCSSAQNDETTNDEQLISSVQYCDAINEFERINNRLFNLRKYKQLAPSLLKYLAIGEIDKDVFHTELKNQGIPDEVKDHLRTIFDDIQRFNQQRRSHLAKYVEQNNLTGYDIRYPYHKKFDKSLDHHFKGEDGVDGHLIIRVCKLGYYFPGSTGFPYRVLCEVETE